MAEPVKICIVIEGGAFQSILSAGVPVEVVVIDYDTEGASPDELRDVLQPNGTTERAHVSLAEAERDELARAFTARAFDLVDGEG